MINYEMYVLSNRYLERVKQVSPAIMGNRISLGGHPYFTLMVLSLKINLHYF